MFNGFVFSVKLVLLMLEIILVLPQIIMEQQMRLELLLLKVSNTLLVLNNILFMILIKKY